MLNINSITEVNHDNTLMLDVKYFDDNQLLFVTIENEEIFSYSILDCETCEANGNWELEKDDFMKLNSYLYEKKFVSYNDEELVIDNFEYLHPFSC